MSCTWSRNLWWIYVFASSTQAIGMHLHVFQLLMQTLFWNEIKYVENSVSPEKGNGGGKAESKAIAGPCLEWVRFIWCPLPFFPQRNYDKSWQIVMICATNVCSQNYKETLFGNFNLILAIFSLHILAPLNWIVQRRQWSGNGVSLLPLFLEKIPTKSPFLLMIISLILSKDTCKA